MTNETALPNVSESASNGQPSTSQFPPDSEAEAQFLRAARILSGDIRPDDYLPVSEDIIAFVADSEARAGIQMLPECRQKMISDLALQANYSGEEILVRYTSVGVIVLGAGSAVDVLWGHLTTEQKSLVSFAYPATPV